MVRKMKRGGERGKESVGVGGHLKMLGALLAVILICTSAHLCSKPGYMCTKLLTMVQWFACSDKERCVCVRVFVVCVVCVLLFSMCHV